MYGLYQQVQERCHHLHTPQAGLRCSLSGNLRGTGAGKRRPAAHFSLQPPCLLLRQPSRHKRRKWTVDWLSSRTKIPSSATPITPPGSLSARHFAQHCTACQLCVSVCPNQVLRPSSDLTKLMQPEMSYERGYCRPECAKCAEVCPTDAIHLTNLAEKSAIQIGHAVWIKENCICITDKMECGNCARHCPAGAIQMVPSDPEDEASIKIPVVNAERCTGCGACENLCPSRPFSAIYVEGHVMHRTV